MSEDTKDTAESPELTVEEQEQLAELNAKKAAAELADAVEQDAQAEDERLERLNAWRTRDPGCILIRHMARNPRTRVLRAARAGHRRQGVVLTDGTRLRRRGKKRLTSLTYLQLVDNHTRLMEHIRLGTLEAVDPLTERTIPYEGLTGWLKHNGQAVYDEFYGHLKDLRDGVFDDHEYAVEKWKEAYAVWKKELSDRTKKAKGVAFRVQPAPVEPKAPQLAELAEKPQKFKLDLGGQELKLPDHLAAWTSLPGGEPRIQDEEEDSDDTDNESDNESDIGSQESSENGDLTKNEVVIEDVTVVDNGASAEAAEADQAQAVAEGAANTPSTEEEDGLSEADLKKMSRAELDDIAVANDINPEDYSSIPKLIAALMGEEGE